MTDYLRGKIYYGDGRTEQVPVREVHSTDHQWSVPARCVIEIYPVGMITLYYDYGVDPARDKNTDRMITIPEYAPDKTVNPEYTKFLSPALQVALRDAMLTAGRDHGIIQEEGDSIDQSEAMRIQPVDDPATGDDGRQR